MPGDILNGIWTVFFNPSQVSQMYPQSYRAISQSITHQGRLSCAPTGRSAAVLFAFPLLSEELNWTEGAASTSILSS